jgi:hypothetical protein
VGVGRRRKGAQPLAEEPVADEADGAEARSPACETRLREVEEPSSSSTSRLASGDERRRVGLGRSSERTSSCSGRGIAPRVRARGRQSLHGSACPGGRRRSRRARQSARSIRRARVRDRVSLRVSARRCLRATAKRPSTTRSSASSAITVDSRSPGRMVTGPSCRTLKPFRALRYDLERWGRSTRSSRLRTTSSQPDRHEALVTSSPYNAGAAPQPREALLKPPRLYGADEEARSSERPSLLIWVLEETFPALDGGTRNRRGLVAPGSRADSVLRRQVFRTSAPSSARRTRASSSCARTRRSSRRSSSSTRTTSRHSRARPGHGGDAGRRHEPSLAGHRR